MACIKAPNISLPDLPGINLFLPSLKFSTPELSLDFCCHFEFPPIPIDLDFILQTVVAALKAILLASGADAILAQILGFIDAAMKKLNSILDLLQFNCPLD